MYRPVSRRVSTQQVTYWCSWVVFPTRSRWPDTAWWWRHWAGSRPCRSRWRSEKTLFRPSETLGHYWECQGYHTGQLGGKKRREWERGSLVHVNESQLYDFTCLSGSARAATDLLLGVAVEVPWFRKVSVKYHNLPTFTEGLRARPGPVGEAHPLRRANQIVALRAAEVDLGTDPEIRLFPWTLGGDARITTGTSCVACGERNKTPELGHRL